MSTYIKCRQQRIHTYGCGKQHNVFHEMLDCLLTKHNVCCNIEVDKCNTKEPQFTNLIRSWGPFVNRNVHKPKLCVLSESYTATDALPLILPACRQPLLPARVFVARGTICHPRLFFTKFVHEPICS
jgi:hypothetical protein